MHAVDVKEAVRIAWEKGIALLAVNMVNLETAQGAVWGAERAGRPLILMVSHNAAQYGGLEELYQIGRSLKGKAAVPVFLHYDHAEDLEDLERAYTLGFESAMLEGQGEEMLKEARRIAGRRVLEVEVETVPKGDRAGSVKAVSEIGRLAQVSGADWIAVNLGTVHKGRGFVHLDLDRLKELRGIGLPLVLHGGSSALQEDLIKAVRLGVAKVNVATGPYRAFTQGLVAALGEGVDPRGYLAPAREALAKWVEEFYPRLWP